MTSLETALRQICADLSGTGHLFALVGGLAVSARSEPRFTRDADIAVAVASDTEAEALIRSSSKRQAAALRQRGSGDHRKPSSPVIDLLFASSGIEPEIVAEASVSCA